MLNQLVVVATLASTAYGQAASCECFPLLFHSTQIFHPRPPQSVDADCEPRSIDAPIKVQCPSSSLLTRTGSPLDGSQVLNQNESSYLERRRSNVSPQLWSDYLNENSTGTTGYDVNAIVKAQPKMYSFHFFHAESPNRKLIYRLQCHRRLWRWTSSFSLRCWNTLGFRQSQLFDCRWTLAAQ